MTTRSGARAIGPWQATNPAKRWTERFFLLYSPVWVTWALCILVPFQLYEVGAREAPWAPAGKPHRRRHTRTGLPLPWLNHAAARCLPQAASNSQLLLCCCACSIAMSGAIWRSG